MTGETANYNSRTRFRGTVLGGTGDSRGTARLSLVFGDVLIRIRHCYRDRPAERKAGRDHIMATPITGKQAKSSFKLKILYSEGNAEVLASQATSIQQTGHQVETAV